jgi:hypothetical protein
MVLDRAVADDEDCELTKAAGHVVATNMSLGAAAVIDPRNADHVEFAKIIPEEARAFSEGMTWLQWSNQVAGRTAHFAASEMATVTDHLVAGSVEAARRFALSEYFPRLSLLPGAV